MLEFATQYVCDNPKVLLTQGTALTVGVFALPVSLPVLGAIGFGGLGPIAGSAAAAFQSANGANAAFALLQSAAMGGYGTAAVGTAVQGGAALVGVAAQAFATLKG